MVDMSTQNTKMKRFEKNMCHNASEAFYVCTTHAQRFYDMLIITMNNIENTTFYIYAGMRFNECIERNSSEPV